MLLIRTSKESEEDADEPFESDHAFSGFDIHGNVLGEDELIGHWHARRTARLKALRDAIQELATSPRPQSLLPAPEDGADTSECCCCWAERSEGAERTAHSAHVY